MTVPTRPPYDPELDAALEAIRTQVPAHFTPATITPAARYSDPAVLAAALAQHPTVVGEEVVVPGHEGTEIPATVFRRSDSASGPRPGIFYLHGGGMIFGHRHLNIGQLLRWVDANDAVAISTEYRLAPEHPDPVPVEDCYSALVWFADHAATLGVDPARIVVAGVSAGGGLAAGAVLLARDRNGPPVHAQLLVCPMLDDRNETVSARQNEEESIWSRTSNDTGWTALLGDRRGTDAVSIYAAPARATDLSGLPPAYLDCGSSEAFRDEDVAYAARIWAAGGQAELHVWPGGWHSFDTLVPEATLSRSAKAARDGWLARQLG